MLNHPIISLLKAIGDDIGNKNLTLTAAGVAFFTMFSLFPSLAALIALWGIWADAETVSRTLEPLADVIPQDVYIILFDQINGIAETTTGTLGLAGVISLLLAFWAARAGVGAMMRAMNVVYDMPNRSLLRHYSQALGMTMSLVILTIIGLWATVIIPTITAFLPLGEFDKTIVAVTKWGVGLSVLYWGISLIQRYGPNQKGCRGYSVPGAVFSTLGSIGASIALSFYIQHFNSYNETYGSLGAVIALLMWLYLNALLVLIGGVLNAQLTKAYPKT